MGLCEGKQTQGYDQITGTIKMPFYYADDSYILFRNSLCRKFLWGAHSWLQPGHGNELCIFLVQAFRSRDVCPAEPVNARCYLKLPNENVLAEVSSALHGHAFVDDKGLAYRAVVAIAPFQRVREGVRKSEA